MAGMTAKGALRSDSTAVVSAQPGILLGVAGDSKAQIAITGRVKVHVEASMGAIDIGDLLVTSNKPAIAMKSQPIISADFPFTAPKRSSVERSSRCRKAKGHSRAAFTP
jgi:hypothetical protein